MSSSAQEVVKTVASELELQSLNAIVGGFAFAAALSWMDLVRFLVQAIVRVKNNGGAHYALTALLTTILSIAVFLVVRGLNKNVKRPDQPIYAVTR
jgi:uncharacterized BrkB/YihY/UPF0761 family membrane protein